jgi:large subunit ribosomal protein L10
MPNQEKIEKVHELANRFRQAGGAMFTEYRGLTVKDTIELRRALRVADGSFAIVKNTLTRLAVRDAGVDEAAIALLEGPTAVAFLGGDAIRGAKALLDLQRRFPALVVKGALVEGRVYGEQDARALATIESKETSLARVAGVLQAPLARIAYLLQAPLSRIAYALAERGRQAGATAEAGSDQD